VVLPDSDGIPRAPSYLGTHTGRTTGFVYGTLTHYGSPFQSLRLPAIFLTSRTGCSPFTTRPTTPAQQHLHALTLHWFRLTPLRSPLLRGSQLLSLPPGTEMFQFPEFPLTVLCVQTGVTRHDPCRVPPFGHPRINARLAAPRGISQPPTSFIGF
jgi:hypothetical protein